jgi:hypothetical protein
MAGCRDRQRGQRPGEVLGPRNFRVDAACMRGAVAGSQPVALGDDVVDRVADVTVGRAEELEGEPQGRKAGGRSAPRFAGIGDPGRRDRYAASTASSLPASTRTRSC